MNSNPPKVLGVLLAGGRSSRMGGEAKYLLSLNGCTLLERAIARAQPQVSRLLLNANEDPARLTGFGLPVAGDVVGEHAGPLAGVLTAMEWAERNAVDCPWIASFATDTPFFPTDLVPRLMAALEAEGADLARAASGGKAHPVFGLWPVRLAKDLRRALTEEAIRKIDIWTARYPMAEVDFPTDPADPFFNVNRPEDMERLKKESRS
ncbi:MAG: molybdenum cofactor guanylyltransferase MobA [Alphaproteobacteria bacterium]